MVSLVDRVPSGVRIDITFDEGTAHGTSGCNTYSGAYDAAEAEGTLSFGPFASTEMACVGGRAAIEGAYLEALAAVTGYQVAGDQQGLVLTGGEVALTYVPEQPVEPLPLEATVWALASIASPGTDAVSSVLAGTEITATFTEGTISGSGGCNDYNATYELDGVSLSIGPIGATQKACGTAVDNQEQAYFAALEATVSWAIEGNQLTLTDDQGQMLLAFTGRA